MDYTQPVVTLPHMLYRLTAAHIRHKMQRRSASLKTSWSQRTRTFVYGKKKYAANHTIWLCVKSCDMWTESRTSCLILPSFSLSCCANIAGETKKRAKHGFGRDIFQRSYGKLICLITPVDKIIHLIINCFTSFSNCRYVGRLVALQQRKSSGMRKTVSIKGCATQIFLRR